MRVLANLRAQMLVAIGLPACWTGGGPAPVPPPPQPAKVNHGFEAALCPRDSIPESVCGERREGVRSCGPRASNLGTVEESKLYLSNEDVDNPEVAYRDFVFDRAETHRFRENHDNDTRDQYCCYSQCTPMTVGKADPVAAMPLNTSGHQLEPKCMPAPPNGTSKPAKADPSCAEGVAIDGALRPYVSTDDGDCCYSVPIKLVHMRSVPGRALRIDGVPRVAEVAARAGWSAEIAPCLDLDAALRTRLAEAWLSIAQLEHASIPAFAALSLRLLAAGAPIALIEASHAAALDEVRHAQLAFALASAYAGEPFGPGRFDIATRETISHGLREIALETFADGCIGETAAAHQAELASAAACDPAVAAALARIAEDEARHGALAWSIVAWCVREGAVTIAELTDLARETSMVAPFNEDLAVHGVLGDRAAADARVAVLRDVVTPCLRALAA